MLMNLKQEWDANCVISVLKVCVKQLIFKFIDFKKWEEEIKQRKVKYEKLKDIDRKLH